MTCRSVLAVAAAGAASLALAGPAGAAHGTGAEVLTTNECYVYDDFTICESLHSVYHHTETESGRTIVMGNTRYDNTFTGSGPLAGCSERTTGNNQVRGLFDAMDAQQQRSRFRYRYTIDCPGAAYSCTAEQNVTYANGELRHEKSRYECTPAVEEQREVSGAT